MKSRMKILIELPDGVTPNNIEQLLKKAKCTVETQAVLCLMKGFQIPDNFKFEEE